MAEQAMTNEIFGSALLRACEETARTDQPHGSVALGTAAFQTWCMAQACGWQIARQKVSRSTWYCHADILRRVGVEVPPGDPILQPVLLSDQHTVGGWFGVSTARQRAQVLSERPGRVMELLDRRFRVVRPWERPRDVVQHWPVGTEGVLVRLAFSGFAWDVLVEHPDWQLPSEARWPEVRLNDFLHWTVPLEASA